MNKKLRKLLRDFIKVLGTAMLVGAAFVTVPGLYIGRVLSLHETSNLLFWILTCFIGVGFLLIAWSFLLKIVYPFLSARKSTTELLVLLFSSSVCFLIGFLFAGFLWRGIGDLVLSLARSDVLSAGYRMALPDPVPVIPDDQNAVCRFNDAWNAPSMRTLGAEEPIYDEPPKGRFVENARTIGQLKKKTDLSKKIICGKKTEYDFLIDFNSDAGLGRLTKEEKACARKLLREHKDAFRLLDGALEAKDVDWGMDWSSRNAWMMVIPKMAYFLNLGRLIRLKALMNAMDGDLNGTVRSLRIGFYMADMLGKNGTLLGEMLDVAVVKIMTEATHKAIDYLSPDKRAVRQLVLSIPAEELHKRFYSAMQWELFTYAGMETLNDEDWFQFIRADELEFYFGKKRWVAFLGEMVYYPFVPFDLASKYETGIKIMHGLESDSVDERKKTNQFPDSAWFFDSSFMPRFAQMDEKVRECSTLCNLVRNELSLVSFQQKYRRWPNSPKEFAKAVNVSEAILSEKSTDLPPVRVTGYYMQDSKSPQGGQLTMGQKGGVPMGSGVGWLYDSSLGNIYVNSTVKDSKAIPYSFYGFE